MTSASRDAQQHDPSSLRALHERRTQLWAVSSLLHIGLGVALVLLVGGASASALDHGMVRGGLLLVTIAFAAYGLEQERRLRRLTEELWTERERAEALAHDALHDPLTGLLNVPAFEERLSAALSRSKRHDTAIAVMVIDLDHFRGINRRYGTSAGDRAILEVGTRLRTHVRNEDAVARLRGDRFAVVMEDVPGTAEAERIAHRALIALAEPLGSIDGGPRVFASAGIVVHSGGRKERPEDLLRDAELARFIAKRRGGSRYEVFDRMSHQPPDHHGIYRAAPADVL